MNIETGKTPIDQDYISFKNTYNEKITLVAFEESLRCAIREDGDISMHAPYTHFTREEVQAVLPYLQAYAASGVFEPAKCGPMQGWSLLGESIKKTASLVRQNHTLETELLTMQEAGVAMAANIVDQGKRIEELQGDLAQAVSHVKDLEELLKEWKKYGQPSFDAKSPDELVDLTEQLLGEDQ
jgi:hypothetical protein